METTERNVSRPKVKSPYNILPPSAFWKTGVTEENPFSIGSIYRKKFEILPTTNIATAGSCFAQYITRNLKKNGFSLLELEPPPPGLPANLHQKFGYSMYSARYGNIYTVSQLLQLAKEAAGVWSPHNYIWERGGRYFDALRPAVEPDGLNSPEEVAKHRMCHISRVKRVFERLDVLIFTLGLTEMWVHKGSDTVYPTAPGVIAGKYDHTTYKFKNARFKNIIRDFKEFENIIIGIRGGRSFKIILTVSPVPLTATASGEHVLVSTTFSKAILRAVAGELSASHAHIDYFPSYEIVTNPRLHSVAFSANLRSVRNEAAEIAMNHFFVEHSPPDSCLGFQKNSAPSENSCRLHIDGVQCQEEILNEFVK